MSHLHEISRVRGPIEGYSLISENYDENPMFCRSGTWIGARYHASESVTLLAEREFDGQRFSFGVNEFHPIAFPEAIVPILGAPAPGLVPGSEHVRWSIEHGTPAITLTIDAQADEECPYVFAFMAPTSDEMSCQYYLNHFIARPCLVGYEVHWPKEMLAQEAACWKRFYKDLERIAHLDKAIPADLFGVLESPGPIETRLKALRGETVTQIRTCVDEVLHLETVGGEEELVRALSTGLAQLIEHAITPFTQDGHSLHLDDIPEVYGQVPVRLPSHGS